MSDVLMMAAVAAVGALVPGVLGWLLLRRLRSRPLTWSIALVSVVTVLAMGAGTALVAQAMFLSGHDLGVVLTVIAISAVASLAMALLLGRQVEAGGRALTLAARGLGEAGEFTAPPSTAPTAELAALTRELAATSEKLATSRERERTLEESRRELVAWISHDLRTPLAGLRAMTEALEDGVAEDPDRYHRQMRVEVVRLGTMIDDLFELSRIESGQLTLHLGRISVYDLVGDAISGAEPLARERGVRLAGDGVAAVPVRADAKEITRVLGNLLANAVRATPSDGTVRVRAFQEDEWAVLTVTDQCGGIPDDELTRVFETGWRGQAARTPEQRAASAPWPAAGLGLAIVRGIVEAHQGRTAVHNVDDGCCFRIALPLPAAT